MTLPELSARLERLSQMDDDRIFKLVLAEAYRTGQLVERDAVAGEYICKCGLRVEPHRCPDTKGEF